MPVIRVSYSILSAWASGDFERALAMYFHEPTPVSAAMAAGSKAHTNWEKEVISRAAMPAVFGGGALDQHQTELRTKRELMLNDWLQLVGVLDVMEPTRGIDFKRSKRSATGWATTKQHKVYQILYPSLKTFEYHCWNPYAIDPRDEVTMAICHLTDKTLEEGVEFVLTYGSEIRDYLESNNLIKKEVVNAKANK
jgi:hypothetical protein